MAAGLETALRGGLDQLGLELTDAQIALLLDYLGRSFSGERS